MATTGAKVPTAATTAAEDPWLDENWTTPTNVYADDGNTANITGPSYDNGVQSYVLKAYTFDFSAIPDGSTIQGVICVANVWYANNTASLDLMQLLDASRAKVGTNQCATPVALGTVTSGTVTKGSSSDTWGNSLTAAWVKDADFGVALGCIATANNADVFIDYVTLEVYYTAPDPTPSVSDSLGTADAVTVDGVPNPALSDSLGAADVVTLDGIPNPALSDSLGASDAAPVLSLDVEVAASDSLGAADTVALDGVPNPSVSDSVGASDAAPAVAVEEVIEPVSVTASETVTVTATVGHYSERILVWDVAPIVAIALEAVATDATALGEATTAALDAMALSVSDSPSLSDTAAAAMAALALSVSDSPAPSDAAIAALDALAPAIADAVQAGDVPALSIAVSLAVADTLGTADTAQVLVLEASPVAVSVSDSAILSETVGNALALAGVSITDSAAAAEMVQAAIALDLLATEAVELGDLPAWTVETPVITLSLAVAEALSLAETVGPSCTLGPVIGETISMQAAILIALIITRVELRLTVTDLLVGRVTVVDMTR